MQSLPQAGSTPPTEQGDGPAPIQTEAGLQAAPGLEAAPGIQNEAGLQAAPGLQAGAGLQTEAELQAGLGLDPAHVDRELVDGFVRASRALVAVAARSLSDLGEDITLPQYRALVVLASRGPQRAVDLSAALNVTAGTGSRMIERLVRKQLVRRHRSHQDRRTVSIHLTEQGRQVVVRVTDRRSAEIARILHAMPGEGRDSLNAALHAFANAAGEAPEQDWALGWDT